MLYLAEADEHVRNVNLYRTSRLASAAQGRGMGQMGIVVGTVVERGQNAADRSGVYASVSVPPDPPIHWACIQTRPAANALQAFPKRRGHDFRSAVVENNQMEHFWPIQLVRAPSAGDQGR